MKKAQNPIGIVIGLAAIVVLLFVFLVVSRGSTTGGVVTDFGDVDKIESNFLEAPFELRAWVVSSDGIKLDIKNKGTRDYDLQSVEVVGCGKAIASGRVRAGESRLFSVPCSLNNGEEFSGEIRVVYSSDGESKLARGNVRDFV